MRVKKSDGETGHWVVRLTATRRTLRVLRRTESLADGVAKAARADRVCMTTDGVCRAVA